MTKDGERILVKKMSDTHLLNTIRMLHRNAEKFLAAETSAAWSVLGTLNGEMAQFYCEQDIDRLEETTSEDFLYESVITYPELVREADRRKLKFNT